jgi:hypothetical protein
MSEEEAVVVPFGKNEHSLLPQSGSNLTPRKLSLQGGVYNLSEIVRELAAEAKDGAGTGSAVDAYVMAKRLTALAASHTLNELRQLEQLQSLWHQPEQPQ